MQIKSNNKRKICFIITSKIHHARNKFVLEELRQRPDVELQLIVGGSALLPQYGDVVGLLSKEGMVPHAQIVMNIEGGNPVAMAKTTGLGIIEFATAYDNLKPDVVVARGDRFEVLSAVIAAGYMNIPIAHIEGGEVTGTIDESVRHAISKFAHIHFATTDEAAQRLRSMGEHPDYVFTVGSPDVEFVARAQGSADNETINYLGVGGHVDVNKPFLLVMQHPVTTEYEDSLTQVYTTLEAVYELGIPAVWFWPNIDAGTDQISKGIRMFREKYNPSFIRFIKNLPPEQFADLLKKAACVVGNSSAGIKEASYFGVPVVNIGTRQTGRLRAENVLDVGHNKEEIKKAISKQLAHGVYPPSSLYHKEGTSKQIADILANVDLYVQKRFHE